MAMSGGRSRFAPIFTLAVAFQLAGCMSSGTQVSDAQIDQFVRGRTTEREVIERLGPPDYTERSSGGEHVDMYSYTKVASGAQSFIPFVGGLIATADTKTKIVRFTFSAKGVLRDWTSSGSAQTINSGLLNQK